MKATFDKKYETESNGYYYTLFEETPVLGRETGF